MCADSESSFVFNIRLCSQKSTIFDIVDSMTENLGGVNRKLSMDNFYNSYDLVDHMRSRKIFLNGTLRVNRGGPKEHKSIAERLNVGQIVTFQKNGINVYF